MQSDWQKAQKWESEWWQSIAHMTHDQSKQEVYMGLMGLTQFVGNEGLDLKGMSVLDLGGGPASILLRCYNFSRAVVVDPCRFPDWTYDRYRDAGIEFVKEQAETYQPDQMFDEVWIYNVLQHVQDPGAVVETAKRAGRRIRVFEWLDTVINIGHLHSLTKQGLDDMFGQSGTALTKEEANARFPMGAGAACYYGDFIYEGEEIKPPDTFRFHLLGYAHLPVSERYMGCAFTQKVVKLSKMLLSLGHEVYLYGCEGSDAPCTEFIQTHTLQEIRAAWGDGDDFDIGYDWRKGGFRHDFNTERTATTLKYYANAIAGINERKRDDDFLLVMQGIYQKPIADNVSLWLTLEPGVGYRGSYCRFRAFESAYLQNFTYGSEHPKQSINGNYYDRVIPNYFDSKDFPFVEEKDDYFLYIGRMIVRKGVWTAIKATEAIGARLILAGQEDPEIDIAKLPPHCEFIGYVEPERRAELMGKARAVFVPTEYLEAFGGVNVEAQMCGTPAITTNFGAFPETVHHGETGFLCNTLGDFVYAAYTVDRLDHNVIWSYASRYAMDNVKWEFEDWFRDLYQLYLSAKHPGVKGWHYLPEVVS